MPSVCFYFQVHQPFRLKRYSVFGTGTDHFYFDDDPKEAKGNPAIMRKVASKCYLPTNRLMLKLIKRYGGAFRISYSLTGVAVEQMKLFAPEVFDSFVELAETGAVEFIAETYYHSLSAVMHADEFRAQVAKQVDMVQRYFGQTPKVFRNTELIYDDGIGRMVSDMGFQGVIAEGADDILGWRSPNFVYRVAGRDTRLLLKNYRLSDDIAFRFGNRGWECWPLKAETYAKWLHSVSGNGETINLFMDYETFGEHQWEDTGIFQFMEHLPELVMKHPDWNFATPSEVIAKYQPVAEMPFHRLTSWADVDRDLTAWRGNHMQESALSKIFALAPALYASKNEELIDTWRKLQTSDHFYYMCTKWFADGDVHAYFSPYGTPYEAFINYMNVFRDFRMTVEGRAEGSSQLLGNGE